MENKDDKEWYYGAILDLFPGTKDWYNIECDVEKEILSLNILSDGYLKGDLKLLD